MKIANIWILMFLFLSVSFVVWATTNESDQGSLETFRRDQPSRGNLDILSGPSLEYIQARIFADSSNLSDHRLLIQNIYQHLVNLNQPAQLLQNQQQGSFHSFTPSILTSFSGVSSEKILIVIALPGPNQVLESTQLVVGALGLIEFLDSIDQSDLPYSLDILLAGSEYDSLVGSQYFLTQPNLDDYRFVLYVKDFGNDLFWNIIHGSKGEVTPGWLLESMISHLRTLQVPFRVPGILTQLYLIGQGFTHPLEEYFRYTLPSLMFGVDPTMVSPFQSPNTQLSNENLSERVRALGTFILDPPEQMNLSPFIEWERQYILIQFEQFTWFVPEPTVLMGTFVFLSGMIIWLRISRHRRRRYAKLLHRFWLTGIGLILTTFFVFISGSIIPQVIITLRGFPEIWQFRSGSFFILTLISGFALLGWVYSVFLLLVPRSQASVFSAIAVITNLIAVFVLSLVQISIAYHYLWSLVCTMFFAESKNRWAKWFWFLISPFWLIKSLFEIFSLEQLSLQGQLIGINIVTNLLVAFLLVPFISMFLRLIYMNKKHIPRGSWVLLFSLLLGIASFLTVDLSLFQPFLAQEQPVSLELVHHPNQPSRGFLKSPAPLSWEIAEEGFEILSPLEWEVKIDRIPQPIIISHESTQFLNRSSYVLVVELPENTRRLSFILQMFGDPVIFNTDFPFQIIPETREIEFFFGLYPPTQITMNLVVPIGSNPMVNYSFERTLNTSDFWINELPVQTRMLERVYGSYPLE